MLNSNRNPFFRSFAIGTLLFTFATLGLSYAESEAADNSPFPQAKTFEERIAAQSDVGNSSDITSQDGNVAFEASTKDKVFTARYSRAIEKFTWDVSIQAPFDDDDKEVIAGDLDGLKNSTSVTFKTTYFAKSPHWTKNHQEKYDEIFKQAAIARGDEYDKLKINQDEQYLEELKDINREEYELLIKKFNDMEYEALGFYLPFLGISAKIGQEKYSYTDQVTAESDDSSETNYSVSTHGGVLTANDYLLLVGYKFQKYYKGGKNQEFCSPVEDTSNMVCKDTSLTEPKQVESNIVYSEMRKFYGRVGINPKISYDLDDSVMGIECGFYFIPNKKGLLVGGVKAGWNSEDDEFTAAFVLGLPFKLF